MGTSNEPSVDPTSEPTVDLTMLPTVEPTEEPTGEPSFEPTIDPVQPSEYPTSIDRVIYVQHLSLTREKISDSSITAITIDTKRKYLYALGENSSSIEVIQLENLKSRRSVKLNGVTNISAIAIGSDGSLFLSQGYALYKTISTTSGKLSNQVTKIVGQVNVSGYHDGNSANALFGILSQLTMVKDVVYAVDRTNNAVRSIDVNNLTVATVLRLNHSNAPSILSIAIDAASLYMYITAEQSAAIYRVALGSTITSDLYLECFLYAGNPGIFILIDSMIILNSHCVIAIDVSAYVDDALALSRFGRSLLLSIDDYDNLYVIDVDNLALRVVYANQAVATLTNLSTISDRSLALGDIGGSVVLDDQGNTLYYAVSDNIYQISCGLVENYVFAAGRCSNYSDGYATRQPTSRPSWMPSASPTINPSSTHPTMSPTSKPTRQPTIRPTLNPTVSFNPTALPTLKPSSRPSISPTPTPSSIPTLRPSSLPSTVPSQNPTPFPSIQITAKPSAAPTLAPIANPSQRPTTAPTPNPTLFPSALPTKRPTSYPTIPPSRRPTFAPNTRPEDIPTALPTDVSFLPRIDALNVTMTTNTSIQVSASILAAYNLAGVLTCAASSSNTETVLPLSYRVQKAFQLSTSTISISLSELRPLTRYFIYCTFTLPADDSAASSFTSNLAMIPAQTTCCIYIPFTSSPNIIYGDPSVYSSRSQSLSSYAFGYSLIYPPSVSISIQVIIQPIQNTSLVSLPVAIPNTQSFGPDSKSLSGSFLLTALAMGYGKFIVSLNISGAGAKDYKVPMTTVEILSSSTTLPVPAFLNAIFTDTAINILVSFTIATDRANATVAKEFPCSNLFLLPSKLALACIWLSDSVIRIAPTVEYFYPGDALTLQPDIKVRAKCLPEQVIRRECGLNPVFNTSSSVVISLPANPLPPTVVLAAPSRISACNSSLTLDPTASTGSGGRAWKSILWSVIDGDQNEVPAIESLLTQQSGSILQAVTVPASLLQSSSLFEFQLTLVNFLDKSSSTSITVTLASPNTPSLVTLSGGDSSFSSVASKAISIRVSASVASCLGVSPRLEYSQKVYDLAGKVINLPANGLDPRLLRVTPYALLPGRYTVEFMVTSPATGPYSESYARTTASLQISSGRVYATISGASSRRVLPTVDLVLDASDSYDEGYDKLTAPLVYIWSCTITSVNRFGDDCSSIVQSQSTTSVVIPAGSLEDFLTYSIQLRVVSSKDGRSDATSISLSVIPNASSNLAVIASLSSPTSIASYSTSLRIDADIFFKTLSTYAPRENIIARWSIFHDDQEVILSSSASLTTLQANFSFEEAFNRTLSFPLLIAAYQLSPGLFYTFRLTVYPTSLSTSPSSAFYSDIVVLVNDPPSNGALIVSPAIGYERDTFTASASSWSSSSLPLEYKFSYSLLASSDVYLTMGSQSPQAFISAVLPSGYPIENYTLIIRCRIIDIYDTSANASTTTIVLPRTESEVVADVATLSTFLDEMTTQSFDSFNIDAVIASVNAVGVALQYSNCENTSASDCAAFNRQPCDQTPNTCGACLSGYPYGFDGDFNGLCSATPFNTSSSCQSNQDCEYNACVDEKCIIPMKYCPSECSDRGDCVYMNAAKFLMTECLATDELCFATCRCFEGYGGQDCSMTIDEISQRDLLRRQMCQSIVNVSSVLESSSELLETLLSSLSVSHAAYEIVDPVTQANCLAALSKITELVADGRFLSGDDNSLDLLLSTISSYLESSIEKTDLAAYLTNLTVRIIGGISSSLAPGQQAKQVYSSSMVLTASYERQVVYSAGYEFQPNLASNASIRLLGQAFGACLNSENGYAETAVTHFLRNPISATNTSLAGSLLHFNSQFSSEETAFQLQSSSSSANPVFLLHLPLSSHQLGLASNDSRHASNQTAKIPACALYDFATNDFSLCSSCEISAFTDAMVTFACSDISLLCPSRFITTASSSSRRLQSEGSPGASFATTTSSLLGALAVTFSEVIGSDVTKLSLETSSSVVVVATFLLVAYVAGMALFAYWDRLDHDYVIYVKTDEKLIKLHEQMKKDGRARLVKEGFHKSFKPRHRYADMSLRKQIFLSNRSRFVNTSSNSTKVKASTEPLFRRAMQADILLEEKNSMRLFLRALWAHHEFLSPFFGYSLRNRRLIRWTKMMYSILLNVFVDTLFFDTFYDHALQCQQYSSSATCLAHHNAATNEASCRWDDNSNQCSTNPPPQRLVFIVVVALLMLVIVIPLKLFAEYLLTDILTKQPHLEVWGISSWLWFGSSTAHLSGRYLFRDPSKLLSLQQSDYSNLAEQQVTRKELASMTAAASRIYQSYNSPEEEVDAILGRVREFLREQADSLLGYVPWLDQHNQQLLVYRHKHHAIAQHLCIRSDGSAMPLTLLQRLIHRSPYNRLVSKIGAVRSAADKLASSLIPIRNNTGRDEESVNDHLLQAFILEQLPFFKRFCLKRIFAQQHDEISPEQVDPLTWLLAWVAIIVSVVFYIYWIFAWGVRNQGTAVRTWGWVFGLSQLQDIVFCQSVRIYLCYVATIHASRPQLQRIHRVFQYAALRMFDDASHAKSRHERLDDYSDLQVVQLVSASCRVAKYLRYRKFFASQILSSLDDVDMGRCQQRRNIHVGILVLALISIPVLLAAVPGAGDIFSDAYMQSVVPATISGFILANHYLLEISIWVLMAVYLSISGLGLYWLWYMRSSIHGRQPQLAEAVKNGSSESLRWYRRRFSISEHLHRLLQPANRQPSAPDPWRLANASSRRSLIATASASSIASSTSSSDLPMPHYHRIVLPPAIELMMPDRHPREKTDPSDGYVVTMPSTLSITSPRRFTRQHFDNLSEGFTIHENVIRPSSSLATRYREEHVTDSIEETLRRAAERLYSSRGVSVPMNVYAIASPIPVASMTIAQLSMRQRITLGREYNASHSIDDYAMLLESIWELYHPPHGGALTALERDEVLESFYQWIDRDYEHEEMMAFQPFAAWFVQTMRFLVQQRQLARKQLEFRNQNLLSRSHTPRARMQQHWGQSYLDLQPSAANILARNLLSYPSKRRSQPASIEKNVNSSRPALAASMLKPVQPLLRTLSHYSDTAQDASIEKYAIPVREVIDCLVKTHAIEAREVSAAARYSLADLMLILDAFIDQHPELLETRGSDGLQVNLAVWGLEQQPKHRSASDQIPLACFIQWLHQQCRSRSCSTVPSDEDIDLGVNYEEIYLDMDNAPSALLEEDPSPDHRGFGVNPFVRQTSTSSSGSNAYGGRRLMASSFGMFMGTFYKGGPSKQTSARFSADSHNDSSSSFHIHGIR
jgi:hypothetical protein